MDIIDTLEAYGLESDAYQLHDYVDVDGLDQIVNASRGDVEVRFTVDGIRLAVTADNVELLTGGADDSGPR
jgi:hypothetical protein